MKAVTFLLLFQITIEFDRGRVASVYSSSVPVILL